MDQIYEGCKIMGVVLSPYKKCQMVFYYGCKFFNKKNQEDGSFVHEISKNIKLDITDYIQYII